MDLTIIIPSFNTKVLLDRCLVSIQKSLHDAKITYEIIVVDNASKDGTIELLHKKYPRVHVLSNNKNLGYGKANNQGIRKARGNTILLLNSDIVVLDESIEKLWRFCQTHEKNFIGGKLLNVDGNPQASSGPMYSLPVVFAMLFCKGDQLHLTRYSPDMVRTVDWASGACLMGQKAAFLDAGLFDEEIFMYMDEIEFLFRAKKLGYSVLFYPDARFLHVGAASSGSRRTPVVNIYRGLLYFYKKHYSPAAYLILRVLLRAKALAAIALGRIMGRQDLVATYEDAVRMV